MDVSLSVEVRLATGDDWRDWRRLRLNALAAAPDAYGSTLARERDFTEEDWRARLGGLRGPALLGLLHGRPVATAGAVTGPGWLHVVAMWTDPSARRNGIATALVHWLEQHASDLGLQVRLDVTVGNDVARAAYERLGYRGTGATTPLREGSEQRCERMVRP